MALDWVITPHDRALDALEVAVRDRRGAVLIGPDGVGKTTLAHNAADWLGPGFDRVEWVTGTESDAAVPFAAVAHLVEIPATGKTAEVLRAARESLGTGLLLVVDDAHLLDRLSAALIYQLAVGGAAKLIVTATIDGPGEIAALWRDGLLGRIDVEPAGHDTARLAEQVAEFIADLPDGAAPAVHLLAVHDPLPVADVEALAGADALALARTYGAVRVEGSQVSCTHPLFRNAIRSALGGPALRRLRTRLVDRMVGSPAEGVVDRLRRAVLAVDSDRPSSSDDTAAAAAEALRLGDLELSEHLGRAAVASGASFPARLTLAYALAWQGRGREADAVLDEIDVSTLSEADLMAWALPRAANQFWMLSEPERATAFLRAIRGRVTTPQAQTTLDALAATFAMNAGAPERALALADTVLSAQAADHTAVGWAASAAALSCARTGRFGDVGDIDAMAGRAVAAGHPGLLRFTSGFGQTTALVLAGELSRAQQLAQELTDFAELQQPGRAVGEVLIADVLLARGDAESAVTLLRRATTALAPTGYSWGPLAWMLLARALGQRGMPLEAAKALSRAESRHGLKSMLFAPELALAKAWVCHGRNDSAAALTAVREGAKAAERTGQRAVALRVLHDAVRLGDARAADAITRLGLNCPFADLTLRHARALAARDSAALLAASEDYREFGLSGAARDAVRQAAG